MEMPEGKRYLFLFSCLQILAALVGTVYCEPPVGLGLNLGIGNYALNIGHGHGGYSGGHGLGGYSGGHGLGGYSGGHGLGGGYAVGGYAPTLLIAGPKYASPVAAYGAPQVHQVHTPHGLNLAAGFDTSFSLGGHGGYRSGKCIHSTIKFEFECIYSSSSVLSINNFYSVAKAVAPVIVKQPVISHHNYDYQAFKPIIKKAVYKPSHYYSPTEFSITPSISYGYSYKLVPTSALF